ncbi:reverse transcriptase domain-containing protein [Tanacetum coccineum]
MPPKKTTTSMTDVTIKELIDQGVADALAEYEASKNSVNGDDSHDSRSGRRRTEHTTSECMYTDFLKCQPLNFKGTEGVVGTVMASKPKTMQEAVKFANELMGQNIYTFAKRRAENKRKLDNNSSNNNTQQQPFKRQNVAKAYSTGPSGKKEYAGTLPLCNKSPNATNNQRTLTCYECRNQGHYRSDCPELKNRNHRNQDGGTEVYGMVYALGGGETDQDPNNIEDNINA